MVIDFKHKKSRIYLSVETSKILYWWPFWKNQEEQKNKDMPPHHIGPMFQTMNDMQ
jgi:hypothetical protein